MDTTRLKALRTLSRCGTIAAAAQALCLSPSAVSQQIAQLEVEAGVALTERDGRGVRLTPAGFALARHAERVMVILDEAKSEMAQLRREVAGELRVTAFPSVAAIVLPGTVRALREAFPRLYLVVAEMEPIDGLAALRSWRADVALIDELSFMRSGQHATIGRVPLMDDLLYALVPEAHALARKSRIALSDLEHEAWALDATYSAFGESIIERCRSMGFEPRVNASCCSFGLVSQMVAAGCSVSVTPGLHLNMPVPGIKAVKIHPEVRRKISVAYRRGERGHPAVQLFLEELARRVPTPPTA